MKWNHLPQAGGIYDQHPQLLAEWGVIFAAQHREEKRQIEKNKPKPTPQSMRGR